MSGDPSRRPSPRPRGGRAPSSTSTAVMPTADQLDAAPSRDRRLGDRRSISRCSPATAARPETSWPRARRPACHRRLPHDGGPRPPAPRRCSQFLLRTSILDQLSAGLCRDGDRPGRRRRPARPARSRQPLRDRSSTTTTSGTATTICSRELLRAQLERRAPETMPDLHRRAAAWYEAHGDGERAVLHAVAAGDADAVRRSGCDDLRRVHPGRAERTRPSAARGLLRRAARRPSGPGDHRRGAGELPAGRPRAALGSPGRADDSRRQPHARGRRFTALVASGRGGRVSRATASLACSRTRRWPASSRRQAENRRGSASLRSCAVWRCTSRDACTMPSAPSRRRRGPWRATWRKSPGSSACRRSSPQTRDAGTTPSSSTARSARRRRTPRACRRSSRTRSSSPIATTPASLTAWTRRSATSATFFSPAEWRMILSAVTFAGIALRRDDVATAERWTAEAEAILSALSGRGDTARPHEAAPQGARRAPHGGAAHRRGAPRPRPAADAADGRADGRPPLPDRGTRSSRT